MTGEWTAVVGLGVFAYQSRGPVAAGLVTAAQTFPAALMSPFTSTLGDRFRRERVVLGADLVMASAMVGCVFAVLISFPLIYPSAVLAGVATSAFYPARTALAPLLARSAGELTANNAASSLVESVATLLGPGLVAVLLATTSVRDVFVVAGLAYLGGALAILGVGSTATARRPPTMSAGVRESLRGFAVTAQQPAPRLLVTLFGVQGLVRGAFNVLAVAVSLHLVGLGAAGAGYLQSAVGVGGLIGAFAAASMAGRRRLAAPLSRGLLLWGTPMLFVAALPSPGLALAGAALAGVGNVLVDVSAYTLLARHVRDDVFARVLGVLEFMWAVSLGTGSLLAAVVIQTWGIRPALFVAGAIAPLAVLAARRPLSRLDAASEVPERELNLLQGQALFRPLTPVALERLAANLHPTTVPAGSVVIREGDEGDRMFFIALGRVAVTIGGTSVRTEGPGDCFGEIALLRATARTATVTALDDLELYTLDKEEFVAAVTGNPVSASEAAALIAARLETSDPLGKGNDPT